MAVCDRSSAMSAFRRKAVLGKSLDHGLTHVLEFLATTQKFFISWRSIAPQAPTIVRSIACPQRMKSRCVA